MTLQEQQATVQGLGCTAEVHAIPSPRFNGYYVPATPYGGHEILTVGFENIPRSWQLLILIHEVGHCMQYQDGRAEASAAGPHEKEWDADRFMINTLAGYGIDGAALNEEVWGELYRQYETNGDEDSPHGLFTHRQTRGNLNRVIYGAEAV